MADRPGKPTKRTKAVEAALLLALEKGMTRRAACAIVHIDRGTLRDWTEKDPAFATAVTRAREASEAGYVDVVKRAATEGKVTEYFDPRGNLSRRVTEYDWRAAAWMLERRMTDTYGQRQKVDMRVDIDAAAEKVANETGLDKDALVAEAERLVTESTR